MNALILAAGYATRLKPLTDSTAKPLLRVAGRPMIEYLYDQVVDGCGVSEVHVVTNHRFAPDFHEWAGRRRRPVPIRIHDDGTTNAAERLGAIGDIEFVIRREDLAADDLLVVAGDNLFDYRLAQFVSFFHGHPGASAVALYGCSDPELVKQYSAVELGLGNRVVSFVEKPSAPATGLVGTATYLYHRSHVPLVGAYLADGGSTDQPGRFMEWLCARALVLGYRFDGLWLDIGSRAELGHADRVMRARRGLEPTTDYAASDGDTP